MSGAFLPFAAAAGACMAVLCAHRAFRIALLLHVAPPPITRPDLAGALRRNRWWMRREEQRADRALPDLLERAARALRAGASLAQALEAAQPDTPVRLATDWRRVVIEAADGGVGAAVGRWAQRRPTPAVRLAAAAIAVAADIGGPQARALDSVATTLRQRAALRAEVHALGAQARASAAVVALAPVAFALLAGALEPSYLRFLLGTGSGFVMLAAGLGLQGVGLLWMARISKVDGP